MLTVTPYPRPIREIHQIEVTTRCNLRCRFCPSPQLDKPKAQGGSGREKIDMTWETFGAALSLVRHYCLKGTQGELALTGIGEALLHPRFVDMISAARATIGAERLLTFSTNGLTLDDALCARLKPYRPAVFVSLHRPERAGPAVEAAKRAGLLAGVNASPSLSAFDWAGQVKWHVSAPRTPCEYLRAGWGVVLVDGRVTTCCLDADGSGVVGTVFDPPERLELRPFDLCKSCHMYPPATEAELVR